MTSNFKHRLIVGGSAFLLLSLSIYFSYTPAFSPLFGLFYAIFISLAVYEYYDLTKVKGFRPLDLLGVCASFLFLMAVYAKTQSHAFSLVPSFILLGSLAAFFLAFFTPRENPIVSLAVTVFGIIYLTIPLSYGIKINYAFPHAIEDGRWWLAYAVVVTKMTDTGAYFAGKLWGKNKLAPQISPGKTIEGALGGLGAALVTSFIFYLFFVTMTFWQSLWLGALIGILAQFGDLAESILKRDAKVKDSGSHLPGLGGALDIVDSLVFTLPLMYLILKMDILHV